MQGIIEMINTSVDRFQETIKDLTEVAKVQKNFSSENEQMKLKQPLSLQNIFQKVPLLLVIKFTELNLNGNKKLYFQ